MAPQAAYGGVIRMPDEKTGTTPPRQVLSIEKFASLNEAEIEIRPFTVLIGEQAAGKSIIAKLTHYFRSYFIFLRESLFEDESHGEFRARVRRKFSDSFPDNLTPSRFEVSFSYGNEKHLAVSRNEEGKVTVEISDFFDDLYSQAKTVYKRELSRAKKEEDDLLAKDPKWIAYTEAVSVVKGEIERVLGLSAASSQTFIPAGRSFFANIENNIFSYISHNGQLDPYLKAFGSYYEQSKVYLRRRSADPAASMNSHQRDVAKLTTEILRGTHFLKEGKDWIRNLDGRDIPLHLASSGQQESLPLCLILSVMPQRYMPKSRQSFYIEEPEAHLFPQSQRSIVELISLVSGMTSRRSQFFITTHSPYVLTAFNNLIQASTAFAGAKTAHERAKIAQIIPQLASIDSADIAAYSVAGGTVKSMWCSATGLIDAALIDSVSSELSVDFDKLIELSE